MRFLTPFRLSTYLLLIYCLLHTAGGMLSDQSLGLAADTVFAAMKRVTFDFNGHTTSYYNFWFGFGIGFSVFLLLCAYLAWWLGDVPDAEWPRARPVAWVLFASVAVNAVLGFAYFFAGPGIFATLVSVLLAVGTLRKDRAAPPAAR